MERAAHSSLPTRYQKKKKTHSLTLLLQNHLDHLNILLRGYWARPPVLPLVPLQANHNSQNHLNNLLRDVRHWHLHNLLHDSFRHPLLRNHLDHVNDLLVDPWYRNIHNQLNICARPPVLSPDACTSVPDDLTSNNLHDFLLDLQPDDGTTRLQQQVEDRVPDAHL